MSGLGTKAKFIAAGAVALMVGGCGGEEGLSPGARVLLAGTTVPPPMLLSNDASHCPPVAVIQGAALIASSTSNVTLGQTARECVRTADGSTLVKVGLEARVVIGAGGAARQDVPVRVLITQGDNVLVSRSRRASVSVPPGQSFALLAIVEEGIVVPASAALDFNIEVGLGGSAPEPRRPRRG